MLHQQYLPNASDGIFVTREYIYKKVTTIQLKLTGLPCTLQFQEYKAEVRQSLRWTATSEVTRQLSNEQIYNLKYHHLGPDLQNRLKINTLY